VYIGDKIVMSISVRFLKKLRFSNAFTLAEVLITLLIIGVVSSIAIPSLINNFEKQAFATQLKTAVGIFQEAVKKANYDNGNIPYKCHSYIEGSNLPFNCPYDPDTQTYSCYLLDGTPEPSDNRGSSAECGQLITAMQKNLNIIKTCSAGHGVTEGCMPVYKSYEEVLKLNNPDITEDDVTRTIAGCGFWTTSSFNSMISFVLNNGMIMFYPHYWSFWGIDINGKKGPNKWGYDVFTLRTYGSKQSHGATIIVPELTCIPPEPGGSGTPTTLITNY
jgi:prepilin-type N-terminal cleavage/methylation domain-containing protein